MFPERPKARRKTTVYNSFDFIKLYYSMRLFPCKIEKFLLLFLMIHTLMVFLFQNLIVVLIRYFIFVQLLSVIFHLLKLFNPYIEFLAILRELQVPFFDFLTSLDTVEGVFVLNTIYVCRLDFRYDPIDFIIIFSFLLKSIH